MICVCVCVCRSAITHTVLDDADPMVLWFACIDVYSIIQLTFLVSLRVAL